MQEREKLTKIVTDEHGNQYVACVHYGAAECRSGRYRRALNSAQGCYGCSMLTEFLNRLHHFENEYNLHLEDDGYVDTS